MDKQYSLRLFVHNRAKKAARLDDIVTYYDLTILFSGMLHYEIDSTPIVLQGGDCILIPPGSHRVRYSGDREAHYFSINFYADPEQVPRLPQYLPNCAGLVLKDLLMVFDKIKCNHNGSAWEEKQILLLKIILLTLEEAVEQNSQNPHITHILQYIHNHFTESISLADVADAVHLSVSHCCSIVKSELNTTIYDLVLKERLLLAQEYILHGVIPLREIPQLCGFQDYSHFSKCFRKFAGVPPSQYGR